MEEKIVVFESLPSKKQWRSLEDSLILEIGKLIAKMLSRD